MNGLIIVFVIIALIICFSVFYYFKKKSQKPKVKNLAPTFNSPFECEDFYKKIKTLEEIEIKKNKDGVDSIFNLSKELRDLCNVIKPKIEAYFVNFANRLGPTVDSLVSSNLDDVQKEELLFEQIKIWFNNLNIYRSDLIRYYGNNKVKSTVDPICQVVTDIEGKNKSITQKIDQITLDSEKLKNQNNEIDRENKNENSTVLQAFSETFPELVQLGPNGISQTILEQIISYYNDVIGVYDELINQVNCSTKVTVLLNTYNTRVSDNIKQEKTVQRLRDDIVIANNISSTSEEIGDNILYIIENLKSKLSSDEQIEQ